MSSHNPITGDALVSRVINSNYADNYDRIFRKKKQEESTDKKQETDNDDNQLVETVQE